MKNLFSGVIRISTALDYSVTKFETYIIQMKVKFFFISTRVVIFQAGKKNRKNTPQCVTSPYSNVLNLLLSKA